jgi:RimJ/RimL family protein N-acetyltransferase
MKSARLLYTPVVSDTVQEFTRLLHDPHIRRYLLDGAIVSSSWCEERILESVRSFQQRRIGIWLVREAISSELVGFCGFLQIIPDHPEPQLVYALHERFTGCGYCDGDGSDGDQGRSRGCAFHDDLRERRRMQRRIGARAAATRI